MAGSESDASPRPDEQVIAFGPFELHRSRRILRDTGNPVRLGSRAFEILVALVEQPGQVVTKEELVARAWPGMFVESSNLRVHIAALRKALRDDQATPQYIRSVSGRGYSFVASLSRVSLSEAARPPDSLRVSPAPVTKIIGRAQAIDAVAKQVKARRLVSVVGPEALEKAPSHSPPRNICVPTTRASCTSSICRSLMIPT